MTTWARSYPIVAGLQYRIERGDNVDADFPEWAGGLLLAEAVQAVGLPWVPWAVWRRPGDAWMSFEERLTALDFEARVVAEGRRRLPTGVSGATLGREWRDAAWRCTVAGMAILDAEARKQFAGERDEEQVANAQPAARPLTIRRGSAPVLTSPTPAPPTILFRRRGGVPRAS